ncbi:hypothetical protein J7J00_05255 [Bacillus sp. ISL-4]|uniref:hypothetical protein n=1 Tax=Bacillus sp. ISL-4 TaxID=2819125 RepID=UPI001BE80060|nr:hypothetical protein [Bacillus sp. ISL-4]MBT2664894.1 hypothetical protein [Bacillus sp. ISL-4]
MSAFHIQPVKQFSATKIGRAIALTIVRAKNRPYGNFLISNRFQATINKENDNPLGRKRF